MHREGALHKDTSFLPHHPVGGEEAGAEGIVLEAGMCDLKKHFFKLITYLTKTEIISGGGLDLR